MDAPGSHSSTGWTSEAAERPAVERPRFSAVRSNRVLAGPGLTSFLACMRWSLNASKLQPRFVGRPGRWCNAVPGATTEVRVFLGEP